jgi:hypothetical protein
MLDATCYKTRYLIKHVENSSFMSFEWVAMTHLVSDITRYGEPLDNMTYVGQRRYSYPYPYNIKAPFIIKSALSRWNRGLCPVAL